MKKRIKGQSGRRGFTATELEYVAESYVSFGNAAFEIPVKLSN